MDHLPLVKRTSDGEFSTIRLSDGMVETIFFDKDHNAVATERSYLPLRPTHEAHVEAIRARLAAAKEHADARAADAA